MLREDHAHVYVSTSRSAHIYISTVPNYKVWENIIVGPFLFGTIFWLSFFLPYKMVDNPAFSAMFSACSHTDQVPDGSTAYKKRK
jgi:hypothetical protein